MIHANSGYMANKIKKLHEKGNFDQAIHRKYHELVANFYASEYVKKSSMVKFSEVYSEASTSLLDQEFSKDPKDKVVEVPSFEVLREVEARLQTFMDEKALRSNIY